MKAFSIALAIVAGILLLIWFPFAVTWSLNTLFGLSIPVTPKTWLATMVLLMVLGTSSRISTTKK